MPQSHPVFHATTILGVIKGGDGQVTFGNTVIKHQGNKVRKLYRDQVLAGFAGAAADAFTLFERFEEKLEQYNGNLTKAAVELASRSLMNVPFTLADPALDKLFLQESEAAGLLNLKGHRSVGGMRASLYNAVGEDAVDALIAFMRDFEQRKG